MRNYRFLLLSLLSLAVNLFFVSPSLAQTNVNVNGSVVSSVSSTVSTFVTNRNSVPVDGITVAILTATVMDSGGNPLPGKTTVISSSRGPVVDLIRCYDGQVLTTFSQGTTDQDGRLVCSVSSTTLGDAVFTAVAEGVELADHPKVTFTEIVEPPIIPPEDGGDDDGGSSVPPPPGDEGFIERVTKQIERLTNEIGKLIERTSPPALGGTGLLVLVPSAILLPLTSSISAALMAGVPALQYLLLSILPSLKSPRRWGTVKSSTTGVPIPGVFVDLINAATGERIKRVLTDKTGRFGFLNPDGGQFWVEIKNPLYQPFKTEVFDVAKFEGKPISFDIYLRPVEAAVVESLKKVAHLMRFVAFVQFLQLLILIGGSLVAVGLVLRVQSLENGLLVVLYALLWVLRFISTSSYGQSGHIIEGETDNAINQAVVQVTSVKKGETQFIHSTLSDESGRFLILVPPGQYMVIATKEEYQPAEKQVSGEIQSVEMNLVRDAEPGISASSAPMSV